jgi:hypothetical protein
MTDPFFLIAVTGLSLSAIVSAIKLMSWLLRGDPRMIAQAARYLAFGLFALSLPLLFALLVNERWSEAMGLSAVMLIGFAFYGPRVLGQLLPHRLVPDWSPPAARGTGWEPTGSTGADAELVHRSIAVLEEHLRRTAGVSDRKGSDLRANGSQISNATWQGNGNGRHGEPLLMSEAEALEVLGLGVGAAESEINESHRRLMQLIHPDRGGSRYFAVKVNQAKEVLLSCTKSQTGQKASAGRRKHRRRENQQDLSQPQPETRE